jgi:hypothetical protein
VRKLHSIRADFTAGSAKLDLIARALANPPRRLADIVRLHDALLFLRAFPDSPAVLRAASTASTAFVSIVRRARASLWSAEDTGLIGTVTHWTTRPSSIRCCAHWCSARRRTRSTAAN